MAVDTDVLQELDRCKSQYRCFKCKKRTFEEMVVCENCKEAQYCTVECLVADMKDHRRVCHEITDRKGTRHVVTGKECELIANIRERATYFGEDGELKERWLKPKAEDQAADQHTGPTTTKHSRRRKKKRKAQKRNGNSAENVAKEVEGMGKKTQTASGKNSALSTVSNGRFGGPVKCDVETKKGEMFGKGWWKGQPMVKPKSEPAKSTSATAQEGTKMSFRDLYDDSDEVWVDVDNDDDDDNDSNERVERTFKNQSSRTRSVSRSGSTLGAVGGASVEEALTGLELVKFDEKKAEENQRGKQKATKHKMCQFCKKTGEMLECSRCQAVGYCDKDCQKKDFKKHKELCKRIERFRQLMRRVASLCAMVARLQLGYVPTISPDLDDLPDEFSRAIVGVRNMLILEIVGPYPHWFRYGVVVKDIFGFQTHIMFYNEYNFGAQAFVVPVSGDARICPLLLPLSACVQPGNFILLLDAHWHHFLDMTVGIRIDDLDDVRFIFIK